MSSILILYDSKCCKLVDFNKFAEEHTKSLCDHIYNIVKEQNRTSEFIMSSKVSKDEIARKRYQGFRIKHKMKSNQVKMYDKLVLSIFLILSFIIVGVVLQNPHINSMFFFNSSSNSNYFFIILII